MPTSTQAVASYAPRFYQGLAQETNAVSHQSSVQNVQLNMTDLPSASNLESVPTKSWKPMIIVLTVLLIVVCAAALGIPFLVLLQHQQQAQQLLLQQQRRQPPALPPHQHQPHQRRQQQPQRQPLPLRPLQPQLLRQRQLQQVSVPILIASVFQLSLCNFANCEVRQLYICRWRTSSRNSPIGKLLV
ncbi:unnamed protein product [Rotaria socialis]|uniref:Uncharacterized protein n=1 Tax=Rotaria socialis TaxID=392032 RepID=A0A821U2J5_9BILA|nr:unnamed protein product [Rotaria socialis]